MIYMTSDTHFFHANIIKYCARPFSSVEEMNEEIIHRWNRTVSTNDQIYHLGDVSFGSSAGDSILHRLHGRLNLIIGNHDINNGITKSSVWESITNYRELKLNGKVFVLSHYPFRTWNKSHHGSINLHGHCHGSIQGNSQQLDVGVDCWNYTPVSVEKVLEKLATLPPYKNPF